MPSITEYIGRATECVDLGFKMDLSGSVKLRQRCRTADERQLGLHAQQLSHGDF